MGQNPTDEEVFQMLSQVDDDGSGSIEFPEFLKVIEAQKEASAAQNDESDLIDAFVAMGGLTDKSGHVEAEKLRRTIKAFELTVDIDRLIEETDTDGSGEIDYDEFKGERTSLGLPPRPLFHNPLSCFALLGSPPEISPGGRAHSHSLGVPPIGSMGELQRASMLLLAPISADSYVAITASAQECSTKDQPS